MRKIYLVGDSTVASFKDYTYYYPRFGYGTKLQEYFDDVEVINLALSGRSSKSFLKEDNYKRFKSEISKGDYLIISFGHNDEKSDDVSRFTDARLSLNDERSFKYFLYNFYVKVAQEKGATPILCSPICRITNDEYKGNVIHNTTTGDYKNAVYELAKEFNLLFVDLTSKTLMDAIKSYDEAILYHAMTAGKMIDGHLTYDRSSVDKTHLNEYGASVVAYYVADAIKRSALELKDYVKDNLVKPDISSLKMNKDYKLPVYVVPCMSDYYPQGDSFNSSNEFYGLAFGNLGTADLTKDGFIAKMEEENIIVGQYKTSLFGSLCSTYDGICGMFRQVSIDKNFIIKAHANIEKVQFCNQSGFGIMLRDDLYINQKERKEIIASNYAVAGVITDANSYSVNFRREATTEIRRFSNTISHPYKENDEFDIYLERLGQRIVLRLKSYDFEFENELLDFDLQAKDFNNMYVGLFATKGTIVKFSNVVFKITGNAKEA